MNTTKADLTENVKKLPLNPGVYIMKNSKDAIIYIGKAKNLKNRVSSYFISDSGHSEKVKKMVENVDHFEYIVTDSEFEALVLECSLIKKHQPKYNILLKDDKGYSYVKITNESWPRVLFAKQKVDDGAFYVGPYTNSLSVKKTVEEVVKIFKIPTCSRNLDKKFKRPCLNYYIKRCSAPCIGIVGREKYLETINEVKEFIKKGSSETLKHLKNQMIEASEKLDFEQAAEIRDKIKSIEDLKNRQKVVSYKIKEQDVIACAFDEEEISFEVFKFREGDLCESRNFIVEFENNAVSMRTEFLKQYYSSQSEIPRVVVLDGEIENQNLIEEFLCDLSGKKVKIVFPKKGEQTKLLEMCKNNAYESLLKSKKNKNRYEDILEDIKNLLCLKFKPRYIEAYDISNLQGSDNVGAMVVFKNAKPLKSAYRKFKIKSAHARDDYGAMREITSRRITRYIERTKNSQEGFEKLPDLILIDGGMAHTHAAAEVLKEKGVKIPVFGMVKDGKHRTRAITTEGEEIEIKNNSRVFSFITSVQDEVHRYAIGYHKKLRSGRLKLSELTKIDGVGSKRSKILLKAFGSVENVSKACASELALVGGITANVADSVYNYFHKNSQ